MKYFICINCGNTKDADEPITKCKCGSVRWDYVEKKIKEEVKK